MSTIGLIQARMGSTRLAGKVLKTMGSRTILEHIYHRVSTATLLDQVIIVTSTEQQDDELETFCKERNIPVFRGSEWDVLDRFYQAAISLPARPETLVRMTSDCPLHSGKVVDFGIREYKKRGVDYFSNSNNEPDFLEDGFDVEVFSFNSLETAWKEAKLLSEREHVTPFIKQSGKFRCEWKKSHPEYQFKLSVDTPADFKAVSAIFEHLTDQADFSIEEVVDVLKAHPEILEYNQESIINAGYQKSLDNDRIVK
ncbi:MAG: glycosyltransferase family protein [Bacteroidota bacterium]